MDITTKQLPVKLSREEVEERGKLAARRLKEHDLLKEEAKGIASGFKTRIQHLADEVRKYSAAVDSGFEERAVEVRDFTDRLRFIVETKRMDTMEIVDTRNMNEEERDKAKQGTLFSDDRGDFSDSDTEGDIERSPIAPAPAPTRAACSECLIVGGHIPSCPTQTGKYMDGTPYSASDSTDGKLEGSAIGPDDTDLESAMDPDDDELPGGTQDGTPGEDDPDGSLLNDVREPQVPGQPCVVCSEPTGDDAVLTWSPGGSKLRHPDCSPLTRVAESPLPAGAEVSDPSALLEASAHHEPEPPRRGRRATPTAH